MVTSKEEVFRIMGTYYGNAYYRSAIQLKISENDLITTKQILDQVNALGYNFCNLHRLTDHEDIRFLPIILEHIDQFENISYKAELIHAFHSRTYANYTPELISLYNHPAYEPLQFEISNALLDIRSKKFIPLYMDIVTSPSYGKKADLIIEILCKFKVPECLPILMNLLHLYPNIWKYTFLQYAHYFKNDSIIPEIRAFLDCDDYEIRLMAKKSLSKFHS